ncbi:MAG: YqzL family protein [Selenomonadales bacterium]|nr:YqzL family protein [Selenomonadales bacterium]
MLKDTLWEIFRTTGQIEAYLMYKQCISEEKEERIAPDSDMHE